MMKNKTDFSVIQNAEMDTKVKDQSVGENAILTPILNVPLSVLKKVLELAPATSWTLLSKE